VAEFNPYLAPDADQRPSTPTGMWREGDFLVGPSPVVLPYRCFLCNADADGAQGRRYRKTMSYAPGYLLILVNLFVLLIVYLFVRKQAKVECSLCDTCIRKRRWRTIGAWCSLLAILAGIAGGIVIDPAFMGLSLLGLVSALVFLMLASFPLRPKGYRKPDFLFKGVCHDMLSDIDEADRQAAEAEDPASP
jgi:hypothetical protein